MRASIPLPIRLTVVSCPAIKQQRDHRQQLVLAQLVARLVPLDQGAHQIILRAARRVRTSLRM